MRFGLATAAGILAASLSGVVVMRSAAETFDAATWRNSTGGGMDDSPRFDMVEEAAEQVRPGMSRADVVALLGEPSREEDGVLIWEAGFRTVQFAWLEVRLDEGGTVVEATARYD